MKPEDAGDSSTGDSVESDNSKCLTGRVVICGIFGEAPGEGAKEAPRGVEFAARGILGICLG